jgi:hypothetical protein
MCIKLVGIYDEMFRNCLFRNDACSFMFDSNASIARDDINNKKGETTLHNHDTNRCHLQKLRKLLGIRSRTGLH